MKNLNNNYNKELGFTIIEIAIVLVIVGLVLGGVFAGREIISTSRQNSLISDVKSYEAAVNTFQLNYNAIPGDMRNATDYWGEDTDSTPCPDADNNDGTCDGDGDGSVEDGENYRVWEQLTYSGIIKESFNFDGSYTLNVSSPSVSYVGNTISYVDAGNYWDIELIRKKTGSRVNVFCVQAFGGDSCGEPAGNGIFTIEDARSIDIKIDDGIPSSGKILAAGTECTSDGLLFEEFGMAGDDFVYKVDFEGACTLMFIPKNKI